MKTFKEMGITPIIEKALTELGFENPMPVQEQVIPLLLSKQTDIIALAQTGTGKTAAFGVPLIQQIDISSRHPQALVLCPTRELCIQIADDLTDYSKYIDGLKILPVYGGSSMETQINALRKGVHIIVATPGRLTDMINRKVAKLDKVSKVVLDEADEMLNMGFEESINEILGYLPKERNTLLFSATMPQEIAAISKKYMQSPMEVTIGQKNSGAENIRHICYAVNPKDRYLALKRIADYYPNIYGIVFCRTRKETQEIADQLINDGYNAESLHGDLSQSQRDYVMQKFRIRNIQLLVATDVAARGIDVDDLTHVIHFSLPANAEAYTHRSGRTGRARKTGISIAIIHPKDRSLTKQIERRIKKEFIWAKIPSGKEICEKQLFSMIEKLERVEIDPEIEPFLPVVFKKLDWLDKEEIIKRLVSLEFNQFLEYYKNAKDITVNDSRDSRDFKKSYDRNDRGSYDRGDRPSFDKGNKKGYARPSAGYSRMFINLGKKDGLYPKNLIDLINQNTRGAMIPLGKIDLMDAFSFFDVDKSYAESLVKAFKHVTFNDRRVSIEIKGEERGKPSSRNDEYRERKEWKKKGKKNIE